MKKPKSERQRIIKANDDLLREIVRLRDKVCQRTGKTDNLQVAHFWSRRFLRVRFDLDNVCLLNAGIHLFWAHTDHQGFRDFWLKRLGQKKYYALELKARYAAPVKMDFLLMIHYYLKKQLEKLQKG